MNARRLIIVLSILSSAYFYLAFRWVDSIELYGLFRAGAWALLLVPFASVIWLFTSYYEREAKESDSPFWESTVTISVFTGMGLISFLFTLTLLRDLISIALQMTGRESLNTPSSFWGIAGISVFLFAAGALFARFGLQVVRVDIPIENLPKEFEGFTIAQISDLHIGATLDESFIRRVVRRTNALEADLIVLTGDIVDAYYENAKHKARILSDLKARSGRYYITGNHEHYWSAKEIIEGFERLGFTVLHNRGEIIRKGSASLFIAGVPDYMSGHEGGPKPDPALALSGAPSGAVRILLAHQPSFATAAAKAGYDLQLSGHTHGGQFFPWTLIVRFFHSFHRGLGRLEKTWVYVNRGTGYWGPPIRLGSLPEISLLTLVKRSVK
jgi:predicted MPP superfamily phosphohydrolase